MLRPKVPVLAPRDRTASVPVSTGRAVTLALGRMFSRRTALTPPAHRARRTAAAPATLVGS